MHKAIMQAHRAYQSNEVPVGALIVHNDTIIAKTHNKCEKLHHPLMHAEMIAIDKACKVVKNKYLSRCDIYVTLEPCYMCLAAICLAKIDKIFYGATDNKFGALSHNEFFLWADKCYSRPSVIVGSILEKECSQLIGDFFSKMRKIKQNK